jgi:hypothetical protein
MESRHPGHLSCVRFVRPFRFVLLERNLSTGRDPREASQSPGVEPCISRHCSFGYLVERVGMDNKSSDAEKEGA